MKEPACLAHEGSQRDMIVRLARTYMHEQQRVMTWDKALFAAESTVRVAIRLAISKIEEEQKARS